jgi:mRNA-degrading endonuclease RelE of RelBE toxin-antitoxin system
LKKSDVSFTTTAEHSIKKLQLSLRLYRGKEPAFKLVSDLVNSIIDRLSRHPLSCPISQQASQLGVMNYHELNIDGYRVLYEYFPEENLVAIALVMSQQQSVEQMLVDYCLRWVP